MMITVARAADAPTTTTAPTTEPTAPASRRAAREESPATSRQARAPATRATSGPATLPAEFAVLQTRNGFARTRTKSAPGAGPAGGPEATLAFKGVADIGSRLTAFIEDTRSKSVMQLSAGDPIARGRIKKLDLDSLEYEVAGEAKRIEVGQNLNGEVVPPTPTSKPAAPDKGDKGAGGPASGPTPEGGPPGPPGAPGEGRRPRPPTGG